MHCSLYEFSRIFLSAFIGILIVPYCQQFGRIFATHIGLCMMCMHHAFSIKPRASLGRIYLIR